MKAWLSLGSNMGESRENLNAALQILAERYEIVLIGVSSFYATKPWGYLDQDDFINIAAEVETDLSPEALLAACLDVEQILGRVRKIHWGPRVVDVDIALIEGVKSESSTLIVPHPRMWERAFVLVPLLELAEKSQALYHELERHGQRVETLLQVAENLKEEQGVIKDK